MGERRCTGSCVNTWARCQKECTIVEGHYHARSCAHVDIDPTETCSLTGRRVYQTKERDTLGSGRNEPLEVFTLHALRHFAVSCWIDASLPPKAVQTFAGPSSLQVTMDRYGHLLNPISMVSLGKSGTDPDLHVERRKATSRRVLVGRDNVRCCG